MTYKNLAEADADIIADIWYVGRYIALNGKFGDGVYE